LGVKLPALRLFCTEFAPRLVIFSDENQITAGWFAGGYLLGLFFFMCRKRVLSQSQLLRDVARIPTHFLALSMFLW
ncbi:hypothetical protein ACNISP_26620, partial [Escherichia coli]